MNSTTLIEENTALAMSLSNKSYMENFILDFEEKILYDTYREFSPFGCHVWMGYIDRDGYGKCNINSKSLYCHRVAYQLYKEDIPKGLVIDHLCHNPSCVNVDHLQPKTLRDNIHEGLTCKMNTRKTSKYIGVHWNSNKKKWKSQINIEGKRIHLGYFVSEEEAHSAYKSILNTYKESK